MSRSSILRSVLSFAIVVCTLPSVAANLPAGLTILQHFNGGAVISTLPPPTQLSCFGLIPVSSSSGTFPFVLAAGDLDGDGRLDLAVGGGNGLAVLSGDGDGTFSPEQSFSIGNVNDIAVADLTGDGRADLVLAAADRVYVAISRGDGTFDAPSAVTSSIYLPESVVVADFNRDGSQDIVVAARGGTQLLLGNGHGGVFQTLSVPIGYDQAINTPDKLAVGDFNRDGKPDLVATAPNDSSWSGMALILLGDGNGGFTKRVFVAGGTPMAVAVGDLNGDAVQDLVFVNYESPTFAVLIGDGSGGFNPAAEYPQAPGAVRLAISDFNNDGVDDVVTAHPKGVSIYLGTGDGTLSTTPLMYGLPASAQAVVAGDFNGDGPHDVIAGLSNSSLSSLMGCGPHISSLEPQEGPLAGREVTIRGNGLLDTEQVTFGGTAATIIGETSATALSVIAPPHTPAGAVDVVVTTLIGSATAPRGFRYETPAFVDNQTLSVPENSPAGTVVGKLVVRDEHPGAALEFEITGGTGTTLFAIDATGTVTVTSGALLNFESIWSYTLDVVLTKASQTDTATVTITITDVNEAPAVIGTIADQSATEDVALTFGFDRNVFSDPDTGDTLTFTAVAPAWLNFSPLTLTFTGTPLNQDVGTATITLTATDSGGATARTSFKVTVANVNDAPYVRMPIPARTATEDRLFAFTVSSYFADVDVGDTLTLSASTPPWLLFTPSTRRFTGTPRNEDVGTATITVTATDRAGATVSTSFEVRVANVNDPPVVQTPIGSRAATEDTLFTFVVPANTFTDVDAGDTLTLTTASLPSWLTFDAATGTFAGTPLNDHVGSVQVTLVATDRAAATASDTFTIEVSNTNDAPIVAAAIADQPAMERVAFGFTFADTTFTDVDRGDSLTYSATLPDGTPLPAWLTFVGTSRSFAGTPGAVNVGSLTVKVTATDTAAARVSTNFTIQVHAAPIIVLSSPPPYCDNGNLTLSSSQAGTAYSWQRDGAVVATTPTFNASVAGNYTLVLATSFGWPVVTNAVTLFAAPSPTIVQTTDDRQVILTAKPDGMAYSWSDGSTLQSFNATASGTYTARVTTPQGCSSTVSSTVQMTQSGNTAITDPITGVSVSFSTLTAGSVTVTSRGTIAAPTPAGYYELVGPTGVTATYEISSTGRYTGPITLVFPVPWQAGDFAGFKAVKVMHQETVNGVPQLVDVTTKHNYDKSDAQKSTIEAQVNSLSPFVLAFVKRPTLEAISGPAGPVLPGTTITAQVDFTDPDTAFGHTATWSWGDGTTSIGSVVAPLGETSGRVTGTHAYLNPGIYIIAVQVSDNTPEGGTAKATFPYVVVVNVDADSVTGGGSIDSPAGAFSDDRTIAAKATFGFTAKTDKNNAPEGEAEFNLHGASFRFKSAAYEWLVVTGAAAFCGGRATVNGEGDYGFVLSVIDGDRKTPTEPDRFRLRVWRRTSGWVAYDNIATAGEDVAPTQIISGGSVVIHGK